MQIRRQLDALSQRSEKSSIDAAIISGGLRVAQRNHRWDRRRAFGNRERQYIPLDVLEAEVA